MKSQDSTERINSAIHASHLPSHEEEYNSWVEIASFYRKALESVHQPPTNLINLPQRSLTRFSIIFFGCIGNASTTRKLNQGDTHLLSFARDVLTSVLQSFNAKDIETFLNKTVECEKDHTKRTLFDLIIQEASVCIAHCNGDQHGSALSKGPLFRDAIISVTLAAHYPLIEGSQHLSTLHPMALQLLEDYRRPVKKCGLEMLRHLGREVFVASWRTTGRADATIETITTQRAVHSHDAVGYLQSYSLLY